VCGCKYVCGVCGVCVCVCVCVCVWCVYVCATYHRRGCRDVRRRTQVPQTEDDVRISGGSGGFGRYEGAPPPEWSPVPVLAVVHGWLWSAALGPAKSLLIDCLVERGELVLPQSLDSSEAGRIVQVEWAFSGKPITGRLLLPLPRFTAAMESAHDCAACVVALQTEVAQMLDAHVPLSSTTLPQDVRLFAGHGGPELTWPDLAWFPDWAAFPPDDTTIALQLLRMGGTVIAATRGDFGTRMLEARATSLCECQPSRTARPTCARRVAVVHCPLRGVDIHRPGERFRMMLKLNQHCNSCCIVCQCPLGQGGALPRQQHRSTCKTND
jgi:hypothetical protein